MFSKRPLRKSSGVARPEEAAPCASACRQCSISWPVKGSGGRPGSHTRLRAGGGGGGVGMDEASFMKGWGSHTQAALGDLTAQVGAHI